MIKDNEDKLEDARRTLDEMASSNFFKKNPSRDLPDFHEDELKLGPLLGQGGFGVVNEIASVKLKASESADTTAKDDKFGDHTIRKDGTDVQDAWSTLDARLFMSAQCIRNGDARYGVKKLRSDLSDNVMTQAIIDLAFEAKFLSAVAHPNIVKMRGQAGGDRLRKDFFIVMDRLYGTLVEKIDEWKTSKPAKGGFRGLLGGNKGENKATENDLLAKQLLIAHDLSAAYGYLHQNKLIYRDIKDENIGFDVRGDVKIFDFGLCKEISQSKKTKDGLYKLTGRTGSQMYMAPEVCLCKPYNLTADVYSFGILLWQIFSLKEPFESYDQRDYMDIVVKKGVRPSINRSWPKSIKSLMSECWSGDINKRPSFVKVKRILHEELRHTKDGDKDYIAKRSEMMKMKSMMSVRGMRRRKSSLKS